MRRVVSNFPTRDGTFHWTKRALTTGSSGNSAHSSKVFLGVQPHHLFSACNLIPSLPTRPAPGL